MRKFLDRIVRPFGYRVVGEGNLAEKRDPFAVYNFHCEGGYDQYKETQIFHNKRKINKVWADDDTLSAIVDDLKASQLTKNGICHGARNGYEVEFFRKSLDSDVIGTDISDTATDFPNMVVWDFHEEKPEWLDRFDFVYTNSLDQAMDPKKALGNWAKQIKSNGRIYIEHTMAHSAANAGEMDPFGAHPMVMPYLFFKWGRSEYRLVDILEIEKKKNVDFKAWVFVLGKGS